MCPGQFKANIDQWKRGVRKNNMASRWSNFYFDIIYFLDSEISHTINFYSSYRAHASIA